MAKEQETSCFQGWPQNTNSGTAIRVAIAALPLGTQLPYIKVPDGMRLVIRAWPLNAAWLQVGFSLGECLNINQSYPLMANDVVMYFIQNADMIWIAAAGVGCFACLTVEQRK